MLFGCVAKIRKKLVARDIIGAGIPAHDAYLRCCQYLGNDCKVPCERSTDTNHTAVGNNWLLEPFLPEGQMRNGNAESLI